MNMDHREKPKDKNLPAIGGFRPASPFFLAPMAGFTDGACRRLAGEMGAALTYTEMVSAKGLYYRGERSYELLDTELDLSPVAFQLFGSDPEAEQRNNGGAGIAEIVESIRLQGDSVCKQTEYELERKQNQIQKDSETARKHAIRAAHTFRRIGIFFSDEQFCKQSNHMHLYFVIIA